MIFYDVLSSIDFTDRVVLLYSMSIFMDTKQSSKFIFKINKIPGEKKKKNKTESYKLVESNNYIHFSSRQKIFRKLATLPTERNSFKIF